MMIAPLLLCLCLQDVSGLIVQLDDASVEKREKAEAGLIAAGKSAIDALRKASSEGSAEVQVRSRRALRAIKTRLQMWEFDPGETAKKALPEFVVPEGKLLFRTLSEKKHESISRFLPAFRLIVMEYASGTAQRSRLAAVDIDGTVTPLDNVGHHDKWIGSMRKWFVGASIHAPTREDAQSVVNLWMALLDDHRNFGQWWGGSQIEEANDNGRKASATWTHGKSCSWTDAFAFRFDTAGILVDLTHTEIQH